MEPLLATIAPLRFAMTKKRHHTDTTLKLPSGFLSDGQGAVELAPLPSADEIARAKPKRSKRKGKAR
jgi:hypothetical protein